MVYEIVKFEKQNDKKKKKTFYDTKMEKFVECYSTLKNIMVY